MGDPQREPVRRPKAGHGLLPRIHLVLLGLGALLAACQGPQRETVLRGPTMGTSFTVRISAELSAAEKAGLEAAVVEALEGVNQRMSNYLEDSELSRLNRSAAGETLRLSEETLEVLRLAREISRRSDGAFDITVGPLVNAWGFGPDGRPPTPPAQEELEAILEHVGFELLELVPGGVLKRHSGVVGDLSAIAKGYAVDRVAEALEGAGIARYMVEVGGEVRTAGEAPAGGPWRIGIEGPTPAGRSLYRVLPISGRALATSGDYRNFYEVDGKRFSHTIDPATGRPVEHSAASVSVVARECASADAWATALLVLGPESGFDLAVQENLAALFLVYEDDGTVSSRPTPRFEALFGSPATG